MTHVLYEFGAFGEKIDFVVWFEVKPVQAEN